MPYTKKYQDTLYSKAWLRRVYVDEERNAAQVAALIGCDKSAVLKYARRFGLPIKEASEAHAIVQEPQGSSAPRPRGKFKDTLHSKEWLLRCIRACLSASKMARLADCSPPTIKQALERQGLYEAWREAYYKDRPEPAPRQVPFRERIKRKDTEGAWRARARRLVPEAPCAVCGFPRTDVMHKDDDYRNIELENLERLCRKCHRQQHALEKRVALRWLEKFGISRLQVYEKARRVLIKQLARKASPTLSESSPPRRRPIQECDPRMKRTSL